MVDTTDIEKKSLEAHVELCAERYRMLELKLETVETNVSDVKAVTQQTHDLVHGLAEKRNSQLVGWGIGIIGFLVATLGYVLKEYVLK
jgi:hypothetical protein